MAIRELVLGVRSFGIFVGSGRCRAVTRRLSSGRDLAQCVARACSGFGGSHRTPASSSGRGVPITTSGQKVYVERLWREFFADPLQWWDHRLEKDNARYPDFKHKKTQDALWLNGKLNPPWVEAELAAMRVGKAQWNIFIWNRMLARHMKSGQYEKTMELFQQMEQEGLNPDSYTFVPVLIACGYLGDLKEGRRIHIQVIQSGLESNVHVGTSLIDMYAKCGSIEDCWRVFKKMSTRDVVGWNAMILAYARCGHVEKALELLQQMTQEGVEPVRITFVGLLTACAGFHALGVGRCIHKQIIQSGWESDVHVGSSLVNMYCKCGSIEDAWISFSKMPTHDVVSWNAMIQGYVKCGQGQKALELSRQMQMEGVLPDPVTFVGLLNACASVPALEEGKRIHEKIIERRFESHVFVSNSLVDMYAKCGSIEDAWRVFNKLPSRDVVAWSAIILGHVKCGLAKKALELSQQMEQEGVEPDPITFVGFLNACASVASLGEGRRIHEQITLRGYETDVYVGSSLVDMYTKCGNIEDAWKVFNKMPTRNVVSWNAMILGYVKCGQGQKSLNLFRQMRQEGVQPDSVTFVGLLTACASLAALEKGRGVHEEIIQSGYESDVFVGNSLVDMYAKCGSISDAQSVFIKMPTRNMVSWNAIIGGYAIHGLAKEAVEHFLQMCQVDVGMDMVTFVSLLSACSHGGFVDEGINFFESMSSVYGVSATGVHYACMVDLLGRAGRLDEAEDLIKQMSCEPGVEVWNSLLGACRVHGNLERGERVAKHVLELDRGNCAAYVLLSNIYAAGGQWNSSADIQRLRLERGIQKQPGCSWIEVKNEVHSFTVDDQQHPQIVEIHAALKRLYHQMEEVGYVPDTKFVLHDLDEEQKVSRLCHHSEKLAIGFGLINTPHGTPLRIFKNLRVCGDCHASIKFIAKIVRRAIIVRDANRFHDFEGGFCSCGDYW